MSRTVLITGGAGFLGSHTADELLRAGYHVRVLDNLSPQVHGPDQRRPAYLNPEVELHVGDVRDADAVARAVRGVDAVVHFAALVGVGQSMYQVAEYTSVNGLGTATLLEALVKTRPARFVVASSMSIYGEGLYRTTAGAVATARPREREQLKAGDWEVRGANGETLVPAPTPEWKQPGLESIYALSKYDQERMALILGRAYDVPSVALRFFNAYGPRQALSNPYTGVLAIFAARLLNGRAPLINEDGQQQRDFVSVHDVARATRLALESPRAAGHVFNIGSGVARSVKTIAEHIAQATGKTSILPEITNKYRVGDIRHCFADVSLARELLGFEPVVEFDQGIQELAAWLEGQAARDRVEGARAELEARGLQL